MDKKYWTFEQLDIQGYKPLIQLENNNHYNFYKFGRKFNIGYEDLHMARMIKNVWWMFVKKERVTKCFKNVALLP